MPMVDGKMLTPDEAIAAARCPECGADLTKVNPIAELRSHWKLIGKVLRPEPEAMRRIKLLEDFIKANNVGTSNHPATPRPNAAAAQ